MNRADFDIAIQRFCQQLEAIAEDAHTGTTTDALVPLLDTAMAQSLDACRGIERAADEDQALALRYRFREVIAPWLSQSWFMRRALEKPRGYPGDFETLEAIYANAPRSDAVFGCALDRYFLNATLARAVRERKHACAKLLEHFLATYDGDRVDVLDIACGPCRELLDVPQLVADDRFRFVGIDQDPAALEHAAARVSEAGLPAHRFTFRHENALRLTSAQRNLERFGYFDLIYSAGLYDYLPDRLLVPLITATGALLRNDRSEYVVAFKDATRYDCTEYQWLVDWWFFQRNEEDCRRLLANTGLDLVRTERDPSGAILFFTLRRRS